VTKGQAGQRTRRRSFMGQRLGGLRSLGATVATVSFRPCSCRKSGPDSTLPLFRSVPRSVEKQRHPFLRPRDIKQTTGPRATRPSSVRRPTPRTVPPR
jgi:hypothetical protein